MTLRGLLLVGLTALVQSAANLLLRGGILRYGEFSLSLDRMGNQLVSLGTQPMFVSGVILYGLAALIWFSVLAAHELSVSYPMLVGLSFILVASGGFTFFAESVSWEKIGGMALILSGIAVMARS